MVNKIKKRFMFEITDLKMAGAQYMLCDLLSEFVMFENDIIVVVLGENPKNELSMKMEKLGVKIQYMSKKSNNFFVRKIQTYIFLSKCIKSYKPDIIHANLDYVYIWIYALIHRHFFYETIHTQPYRIYNNRLCFFYKLLYRNRLIRPILLTDSGRDEFCQLFKTRETDVEVIANPVKVDRFSNEPILKNKEDSVKFVSVARFHKIKNHRLLINAFRKTCSKIKNCELYLAGDGELYDDIKKYTLDLGIMDKVIFLGEVEDIPGLLAKSDVMVISSDSESFSLVLVEAMAAGLPVIATSVGGMRDIVRENGVLVKPNDVEGMANAMIGLAENPMLRYEYGMKSKKLVKEYSLENIVEKYKRVLC